MTRVVLLTGPRWIDLLRASVARHAPGAEVEVVTHKENFEASRYGTGDLLIGFSTGIIVPGELLDRLDLPAFNFHAAPPTYPGRDPHHWAVFDQATTYGATAHVMVREVDAGPIVAVERFRVPPDAAPHELRHLAEEAAIRLWERLAPDLLHDPAAVQPSGQQWSGQKRTRRDLHSASRISTDIDPDDFRHRLRSFGENLMIELHGHLFRYHAPSRLTCSKCGRSDDGALMSPVSDAGWVHSGSCPS